MNVKPWLILAATLGVTSVAMGAFAAHALKALLSEYELSIIETGARYQMYHALAIFAVTALAFSLRSHTIDRRLIIAVNWMFTAGIFLFSGSLYLLAMFAVKWMVYLTPIGGISFIIAWFIFIWFCIKTDFNELSVTPDKN